MNLAHLICIIAFYLSAISSYAQEGRLFFNHLRLEDGLSEQTNSFIYKDSKGFVWISSVNGLNRFDGVRIHQYYPDPTDPASIYGENIQSSFFEDKTGLMWFCTFVGINAYDPKQDTFSHSIFVNQDKDSVAGYHSFYLDSMSNLWTIVEGKHIYKFNTITRKFSFVTDLKFEAARAIMSEYSPGKPAAFFTYYLSTPGAEIFRIDQQSNLLSNDVLSYPGSNRLLSPKKIVIDGDSLIWIAQKDSLVKYQWKENKFSFFKMKNLRTIENLEDDRLLLSIVDHGIWEYDKSTNTMLHQHVHESDNSNSLISNNIEYLSKDRDGGIWASSAGNGISYANPAKIKFRLNRLTSLSDQSPLDVNGMCTKNEAQIFCSTRSDGFFTLNRNRHIIKEWRFEDPRARMRTEGVFSVFSDRDDNKWISTFNGLSVIPTDSDKMIHVTDDSTVVWYIQQLDDKKIIFSPNAGGLYELQYQDSQYSIKRIDSTGFQKVYVPVHQDKNGLIWLSEQLQEIILLDPVSYKIRHTLPIEGTTYGLVEAENDSIIWIGCSNGLFKVSTDDYQIRKVYNHNNKLPCAGITNLMMDVAGNLWLSCRNQILMFDPRTEETRAYDEQDGLPQTQISHFASYQFQDGEMWFATNGALVSFNPSHLKLLDIKAIPQITSLLINDEPPVSRTLCQTTGATNISEIQKLKLTHRENTISFIVNSLEYSAPEKNKVKFILEGVDPDWVEAPSGTLVRYPNLRAGSFHFKVKAANSDGEYNDTIRELVITIPPPFYRTWWFITLSALVLLGLILYIMYLIFSKKIELQKERLRLYENLHDEVGSRLTSIVFMAEEIAQNNNNNPKLQQISKVAKSIVSNMRRLVWATDPDNDTMESLVQKIRMDKSMILDDKIDFHLDLDPKLNDMNLQGEIRYQMTSVISEALNNISKYAGAKNVRITISKENNMLNLRIRDDGVGFNPEETKIDKVKSSGYGLGNMQKRIARVKGSLSIHSQPGQGTSIDVRIPFT